MFSNDIQHVRFEVFTAVTMKNGITSQKMPFFNTQHARTLGRNEMER
jgi:hypothetical protein